MTNIHVKAANHGLTLKQLKPGDIFRRWEDEEDPCLYLVLGKDPCLYLVLGNDGHASVKKLADQAAAVNLTNGNIIYINIHIHVVRMKSAEFTED